ncbi:MAG: phosphatase PAP2 family protein [Dokdonella sp.]
MSPRTSALLQQLELRSGDWRLCQIANRWCARVAIARFFAIISRLGDGLFWYGLMAIMLATGGAYGAKAALHLALTGLVALALYRGLKRWTRRPRPFRSHVGIIVRVAPLDEFSFPSGHTLHAVSFTLIAIAWYPQLACVLWPFTALVAMSRVVLGLHYPSDVIAAALIGVALSAVSLWLVPGATLF